MQRAVDCLFFELLQIELKDPIRIVRYGGNLTSLKLSNVGYHPYTAFSYVTKFKLYKCTCVDLTNVVAKLTLLQKT